MGCAASANNTTHRDRAQEEDKESWRSGATEEPCGRAVRSSVSVSTNTSVGASTNSSHRSGGPPKKNRFVIVASRSDQDADSMIGDSRRASDALPNDQMLPHPLHHSVTPERRESRDVTTDSDFGGGRSEPSQTQAYSMSPQEVSVSTIALTQTSAVDPSPLPLDPSMSLTSPISRNQTWVPSDASGKMEPPSGSTSETRAPSQPLAESTGPLLADVPDVVSPMSEQIQTADNSGGHRHAQEVQLPSIRQLAIALNPNTTLDHMCTYTHSISEHSISTINDVNGRQSAQSSASPQVQSNSGSRAGSSLGRPARLRIDSCASAKSENDDSVLLSPLAVNGPLEHYAGVGTVSSQQSHQTSHRSRNGSGTGTGSTGSSHHSLPVLQKTTSLLSPLNSRRGSRQPTPGGSQRSSLSDQISPLHSKSRLGSAPGSTVFHTAPVPTME